MLYCYENVIQISITFVKTTVLRIKKNLIESFLNTKKTLQNKLFVYVSLVS